jgi:cysteine desulfurase / selenocysteine lyase
MHEFPLGRLRSDTVGLSHSVFMNNAGASLRPRIVTETIKDFLDLEDRVGGHGAAEIKAENLSQVYSSIASMIGAKGGEIALMESQTIAWHAIVSAMEFKDGDEVIVTPAEYISGLMALCELRRRSGVVIRVVDYDATGVIDLEQLEQRLSARTRLVCLTHIATSNGTIHPVTEAGRIIKQKSDAFFLLDACQSVGQRIVNVQDIGCDGLTATGRKYLRGPRGTGFLYVAADAQKHLRPRFPDGHRATLNGQDEISLVRGAACFETFEKSLANVVGLGAAVDYALDIGMENIETRIDLVSQHLRAGLEKVEGVETGETLLPSSGLVTLGSYKVQLSSLYQHLGSQSVVAKHITVDGGAWDVRSRVQKDVIRLSVHYYNTLEECNAVVDLIENYLAGQT